MKLSKLITFSVIGLCIQPVSTAGQWSQITPPSSGFTNTRGVAVDKEGNLYVCEWNRIDKLDTQGEWSFLAGEGAGLGEVNHSIGIAIDIEGNFYVAESGLHGNNRIQMRDKMGNWIVLATSCPETGDCPTGEVWDPSSVAIDIEGNLYIADQAGSGRIQIRDVRGNWSECAYPGCSNYSECQPGHVLYPYRIAVDKSGNLYVMDIVGGGRIQKRDTFGNWSVVASFGTDLGQISAPWGAIAVDKVGNIYVGDQTNKGRIQKLDIHGNWTVLGTYDSDHIFSPMDIAVDEIGIVYLNDQSNNDKGLKKYVPDTLLQLSGDANGDGVVNIQDATLILQFAVGILSPDPSQKTAADMNGDGVVNVQDATLVLKKAVGL